jgi:Rps23 Pro-64 3,4-dihydroxylase Tpa1-like proline 4-hydroxylase
MKVFFVLFILACASFVLSKKKGKVDEIVKASNSVNSDKSFAKLQEQYTASLASFVTDSRMQEIVKANQDYKSKLPFPHTFYDGLFPNDVLEAVEDEIPDAPVIKSDGCVEGSQKCYNAKLQNKKNAFDDESAFGPATLSLFKTLKSTQFTAFLSQITGIQDLIPDPEYRGSGIHQTLPGGYLGIHADFNRYAKFDLHRRVNAFIFLNPNWNESYGGHLELWSKDLKTCGAKISPDHGRFVVFSSTDFSYHGQPHPLTCPSDRSRRSLALYYYTKTRPTSECIGNNCYSAHTTLFQTPLCATCQVNVVSCSVSNATTHAVKTGGLRQKDKL